MTAVAGNRYDIIIVGGGMVGSALACALGDTPWRLALIEGRAADNDWPADSFDLRVSAISRASQQLFEELQVWPAMQAERVSPYQEMHVWDAGGNGSIHFDSADIGEPNLGHIIENRVITRALAQRAAQFDNIDVHCPAKPQHLELQHDGVQLELDSGEILRAELIVGADGGQSWVRQQAGISINTQDYQQSAVVANVRSEQPHRHTAWQRFLPTGPLAFLPLTDNVSAIVWSTTPQEAERLCALDDEAFRQELEAAFASRLGRIVETGPRAHFPLRGQHASHYVKPHLALIGDAAHTIHPLAGQGVNLGFADVRALSQALREARQKGQAIGSLKTLRRYERSRRGDNLLMLESMGIFKRLFSNTTPGLRQLRNLGLNLSDRANPLKHFFMSRAMGLGLNK